MHPDCSIMWQVIQLQSKADLCKGYNEDRAQSSSLKPANTTHSIVNIVGVSPNIAKSCFTMIYLHVVRQGIKCKDNAAVWNCQLCKDARNTAEGEEGEEKDLVIGLTFLFPPHLTHSPPSLFQSQALSTVSPSALSLLLLPCWLSPLSVSTC